MMVVRILKDIDRIAYYIGLCGMIASLSHSKISVSIAQFIMAGAFAMYRFDYKKLIDFFSRKSLPVVILLTVPVILYRIFDSIVKGLKVFWKNKPAVVFSSILLMHVIGLLFTTDFDYAVKDLRTKLPLFLLPLFLSTSETFSRKSFYWIMLLFVASILARSFINSWYFWNGWFVDIRDISRSISHIIVALNISFSLFITAYFIINRRTFPLSLKVVLFLSFCWMLSYLVMVRSATGVLISLFTMVILGIVIILKSKKRMLKWILGILILLTGAGIGLYLRSVVTEYYTVVPVDFSKMDKATAKGNPYENDFNSKLTENGNLVWIYVQFGEMREAWNTRSAIPFDSYDRKGQKIMNTLARYLSSKGLRKDADGMAQLTKADITAVENGVANYLFTKKYSFRGRIYEVLMGYDEYLRTGNPTGSSVMQRMEFWRASRELIKGNWLTGVGTGDMNIAFRQEYEKMHSRLSPDQRWRSHNQFLSIFVGFGVFGLLWFLFALLYPPIVLRGFNDYFFLVFFIIAMLSMIPEDTIETQFGVTLVSFFYSFLLFSRKDPDPLP
jgi:hypothetical protein